MNRERVNRRALVLHEAARLFTAGGFHGTSMDDIAAALGFTKPALYHYFRSKSDILYELYRNVAGEINGRLDQHPPEWDAEQRLHQTMRDVMQVVRERPVEVNVFYQEGPLLGSCLPRRQARELRAMEQRFTDYVTDAVEDAMDAGVMRQMDPTLTAYAFIAMVSWASRWYQTTGRASAAEIADLFFSIGMDGARKRTQ
jgi:TetR/AcrR family transcriptional regulator, cholesterol catabolism regulator